MLCLWCVGNHGGDPSHKDIEEIAKYLKTSPQEIKHSNLEKFFCLSRFNKSAYRKPIIFYCCLLYNVLRMYYTNNILSLTIDKLS